MGRDEQVEEREVLNSIFPEEITDIDETHFRVSVALDLPAREEYPDTNPTLILDVTFPEKYPDVAPHLDLSNPHDGPKPPRLDLATDKTSLLAALEPTIEESLGMAMVFSLITGLKDAAEQLIEERATAADQAREAELRAEEEKEDAKFHGEKVTRERFLEWREKFRQDMAEEAKRRAEEAEAAAKKGAKPPALGPGGNLTGRQLWERGLANALEEEEDDDDDGKVGLVGKEVEDLTVSP